MIECFNCKQDFEPKSKKQIFCSGKCRLDNWRKKKSIYKDGLKQITHFVDEQGNKIPVDYEFFKDMFDKIEKPVYKGFETKEVSAKTPNKSVTITIPSGSISKKECPLVKMIGESGVEFRIRVAEWEEQNK